MAKWSEPRSNPALTYVFITRRQAIYVWLITSLSIDRARPGIPTIRAAGGRSNPAAFVGMEISRPYPDFLPDFVFKKHEQANSAKPGNASHKRTRLPANCLDTDPVFTAVNI